MIKTGYQTSDQKFFTNKVEAEKHEANLQSAPEMQNPDYPWSCAYNGCMGCSTCLNYVYGRRY